MVLGEVLFRSERREQMRGGIVSQQFITTSAEVTPNGGLVRESPPKMALNQVKDL